MVCIANQMSTEFQSCSELRNVAGRQGQLSNCDPHDCRRTNTPHAIPLEGLLAEVLFERADRCLHFGSDVDNWSVENARDRSSRRPGASRWVDRYEIPEDFVVYATLLLRLWGPRVT